MWKKIKPYVISIILALAVGGLSALLTMGNMDIYNEVKTPPLSPPSILFPIVWTILYVLMGISAAIVYINQDENFHETRCGLRTYGISLFFNFLWSIVFFNFKWFGFAFFWLLALLFFIIKTIVCYFRVNKLAAYLQIPYAIWVAFAGYLNFGIWMLNM
mgnify:CR=1 FL=1